MESRVKGKLQAASQFRECFQVENRNIISVYVYLRK